MIGIQVVGFEIADYADAYGRSIVPSGMGSYYVIAAGTAFVDRSALSHDVVVADVAPTPRDRVVAVGGTKQRSVVEIFEIVFGSVVKYDFFDFSGFFDGPNELPTVFDADCFDRLVLLGERRRDTRFDTDGFFTSRFARGADFAFAFGGEFFEIGFPSRGILVPVPFVRAPIRPADDANSAYRS